VRSERFTKLAAKRFGTEKGDSTLRCGAMKGRPLEFLLLLFAGWASRRQRDVIDYLKLENRILREHLQGRRLQFTDDERRRLAVRGQALGRRLLRDVTSLLTPDTILRWYRQLIAAKYDGSSRRGPGRPPTARSIQKLVVKLAHQGLDSRVLPARTRS
jgi:hypothetical protein